MLVRGDGHGRIPLETIVRLSGFGFGADGALLACPHVAPIDEAILRFRVDNPRFDVVNGRVKTVAAVNHLPVFIDDAVACEGHARAAPAPVVLQASADVIGLFVVEGYFIKLADGYDVQEIPIFSGVVAPMDAAVGTGDHVIGIGGIDPHGVEVAVNAVDALRDKRFSAVLGVKHLRAEFPNAQVVVGINANLAVIGRAWVGFAHALPGLAFVFAAERAALFMLNLGIDDVRILAVNVQSDAAGVGGAVLPRQALG